MKTKILKTVLLCLGLLCCALIPIVSLEGYNSLSEYVDSNNYIIYFGMFSCISTFFLINSLSDVNRRFDIVLSFGMMGILIFDVYNFRNIHNFVTVFTLVSCLVSIVYYTQKKNLYISWFLVLSILIVFILGFVSDNVYFAFAEIITIYLIALHRLKKLWIKDEYKR